MQCVLDAQHVYLYSLYPYLDVSPYLAAPPLIRACASFPQRIDFLPLPLVVNLFESIESLHRPLTMKFLAVLGLLLACSSRSEAREGPAL